MSSFIQMDDGNVTEYHVGERININPSNFVHIVRIQADEDELGLILKEIKGIPRSKRRVQMWFGDHAKYIVSQIYLRYWNR